MLNSNRSFVTSVSCVLLAFALHAETAVAALTDDPPTIKVSYAELDLSKPAGAEELYRRIRHAAHAVCDHSFRSIGPVRAGNGQKKCEEKAISDAVSDVNRPLLSALWKQQTRLASAR